MVFEKRELESLNIFGVNAWFGEKTYMYMNLIESLIQKRNNYYIYDLLFVRNHESFSHYCGQLEVFFLVYKKHAVAILHVKIQYVYM